MISAKNSFHFIAFIVAVISACAADWQRCCAPPPTTVTPSGGHTPKLVSLSSFVFLFSLIIIILLSIFVFFFPLFCFLLFNIITKSLRSYLFGFAINGRGFFFLLKLAAALLFRFKSLIPNKKRSIDLEKRTNVQKQKTKLATHDGIKI